MKPIMLLSLYTLTTVATAQQSANPISDRMINRHDRDKDGVVTQDEFSGDMRIFILIDADNDGTITRAEIDAEIARRNNRQQQGDRYGRGRDRYSKQGPQPGEQVPDLTVYNLEGQPVALSSLWKDKPALIVTASATCPISVRSCPTLKKLASVNVNYVNAAVLYIREAHPAEGAPSADRDLGARTQPQPKTAEERLTLARLFTERVDHGTPILVDGIDNKAAEALGAGPNIGLLVNTDGRVIHRQGWFDPNAMTRAFLEFDGTIPEAPMPPLKREN